MMSLDLKNIHLGFLLKQRIEEKEIDSVRICKFINCTDEELTTILSQKNLTSDLILKFSILLEYDFFRLYSNYLILYSPPSRISYNKNTRKKSLLPQFRKSLYTQEIISFILELINSGKKSKQEVLNDYQIPKTTLYKWMSKYKNGF